MALIVGLMVAAAYALVVAGVYVSVGLGGALVVAGVLLAVCAWLTELKLRELAAEARRQADQAQR